MIGEIVFLRIRFVYRHANPLVVALALLRPSLIVAIGRHMVGHGLRVYHRFSMKDRGRSYRTKCGLRRCKKPTETWSAAVPVSAFFNLVLA